MKKNIAKSLCFVVVLFIILIVLSNVFKPKNNLKEYGMHYPKANGILGENENTIDIVVVGDSESYRSIIPLKLWKDYGYTTYLCGTPEQRMADSYKFVRKAFKNQSPKIVILEADNLYIESKLTDLIKNCIFQILPIIEYHDRWKNIGSHDLLEKVKYTGIEEFKGYEYSTDIQPADDTDYMVYSEDIEEIQKLNKIFVKLINQYCKEHNAEFIIVSAPQTEDWNYARHNAVKKLADEQKVEYIDMNVLKDEINIDWDTETSDRGVHVNYKGGKKTTKYLGEYLKNKNILEDHRNDENYSLWSNALNKFKKITDDDNQGM